MSTALIQISDKLPMPALALLDVAGLGSAFPSPARDGIEMDDPARRLQHQAAPGSRLVGAKVLVAEDEAFIALDIAQSLQDQGCIVIGPTATVADTLASLARDRPDVALLDLHLLNGLAVPIAATLVAMGVPFALLTADPLDALEDASLAGVPWISKPWSAGDIERMVEQLLAAPPAGPSQTVPAAVASSLTIPS